MPKQIYVLWLEMKNKGGSEMQKIKIAGAEMTIPEDVQVLEPSITQEKEPIRISQEEILKSDIEYIKCLLEVQGGI